LTNLATKKQILEGAGYKYSFDREIYFNRRAKKAFSVEFIEDSPEEELEQRIREETPGTEWRFFFNNTPSDAVKRELADVLG
jgi:ABC-type transporter lipoprotein component MlaA